MSSYLAPAAIGGRSYLAPATAPAAADTTAPTVSIASSSSSITAAGSYTLTATASDNVGVAYVEFYRGATLIGTDSVSPFTATETVTIADNGSRIYTAKAFDAAGNSTVSSSVTVTINIAATTNVAPVVSISASSTSVTTASSYMLMATASDSDGILRVDFKRNGSTIASVSNAPFTVTESVTSANNGTFNYTATAYDTLGASTISNSVAVTINIPGSTVPGAILNRSPTPARTRMIVGAARTRII
jgi:chitinase